MDVLAFFDPDIKRPARPLLTNDNPRFPEDYL